MCLDEFPHSQSRPAIMVGLEHLVDSLMSAGVEGELWVNGSFLTRKTDPVDVDVVLRVESEFFDSATSAQLDAIERIEVEHDMLKTNYLCDAYTFVEYPLGHPLHSVGQDNRDYWEDMWSHDRRRNQKGFAVITLIGATNV